MQRKYRTIYWYARCDGLRKMGPFFTQLEATEAIKDTDGFPSKGAFVWPEEEGPAKKLESPPVTTEPENEPPKGYGLHHYRLKTKREEKRFAEAWKGCNDLGQTLAYLLNLYPNQAHPPEPSKHDAIVAATVVQWFGSPAGQSFLQELGYTRSAEDKRDDFLDEIVKKRTKGNPAFPELVEKAEAKRNK